MFKRIVKHVADLNPEESSNNAESGIEKDSSLSNDQQQSIQLKFSRRVVFQLSDLQKILLICIDLQPLLQIIFKKYDGPQRHFQLNSYLGINWLQSIAVLETTFTLGRWFSTILVDCEILK